MCRRRKAMAEAYCAEKYLGLCKMCSDKISRVPKGAVFPGTGALSSLFAACFYGGSFREAVKRYKFTAQTRYAKVFAIIMYERFADLGLHRGFDMMTAVPISRKRLWERGFSQTELLARPLADMLSIPFDGTYVFKKRHNQRQSMTRDRQERLGNVKDVYIADSRKVCGKDILLFDDIYTTGATMESCAAELVEKGAHSVTGIVLAKTGEHNG